MDRHIWTAIKYDRYTQLIYIYSRWVQYKFLNCDWFSKWSNLITYYNLTQLITKVSSSIIDHLYTNHSEKILENVSPNLSMIESFPIAFTSDTVNTVNDKNKVKAITYRCYKTFQEQHYMNDLSKYFHVLDNLNIIEDQI